MNPRSRRKRKSAKARQQAFSLLPRDAGCVPGYLPFIYEDDFGLYVQASMILVGSTASLSTCSSITFPSLSMRNVARRAEAIFAPPIVYSFSRPYSLIVVA